MWQFSPCLQYTSDRGKENTAEILYFDLECELFVGYGGWNYLYWQACLRHGQRFSLMSLSIQSFEKCISKGLHKIFCMFLSAINLNVKGYFKCSLESHWSTGKKKCSFIFTGNSFQFKSRHQHVWFNFCMVVVFMRGWTCETIRKRCSFICFIDTHEIWHTWIFKIRHIYTIW